MYRSYTGNESKLALSKLTKTDLIELWAWFHKRFPAVSPVGTVFQSVASSASEPSKEVETIEARIIQTNIATFEHGQMHGKLILACDHYKAQAEAFREVLTPLLVLPKTDFDLLDVLIDQVEGNGEFKNHEKLKRLLRMVNSAKEVLAKFPKTKSEDNDGF